MHVYACMYMCMSEKGAEQLWVGVVHFCEPYVNACVKKWVYTASGRYPQVAKNPASPHRRACLGIWLEG